MHIVGLGYNFGQKSEASCSSFWSLFSLSGCNLLDSLAMPIMASSTVSRNVLTQRVQPAGQSGSLKGFEEALGGGGGADVEIDIIAEQLIASSFHLCAVHHFLGHYNSFFLSCSFLAITIATEGLTDGPKMGISQFPVLFATFPFSILVLALQLISAIVVIDRSLAADELGLAPHESADGTTRVGVIQNDTRLIRDYL